MEVDGYKIFWVFHDKKFLILCYVLTVFHSPARFTIWMFFPVVLAIMETVVGKKMKHRHACLLRAEYASGDVLTLYFKQPPGFVYMAG